MKWDCPKCTPEAHEAHDGLRDKIDRLTSENEKLRQALKYLTEAICLRNLNVKKDFSLINAHAFAIKTLGEHDDG